jgi:acyl dehydratase
VRAGDRLTGTLTVENVRQAAGNDLLTTKTEIATVDGEPVLTAYQITVVRGEGK